jgi:hypothetical protein
MRFFGFSLGRYAPLAQHDTARVMDEDAGLSDSSLEGYTRFRSSGVKFFIAVEIVQIMLFLAWLVWAGYVSLPRDQSLDICMRIIQLSNAFLAAHSLIYLLTNMDRVDHRLHAFKKVIAFGDEGFDDRNANSTLWKTLFPGI